MKFQFVVPGKARSVNNARHMGIYRKKEVIEWQDYIGWCAIQQCLKTKNSLHDEKNKWKIHIDYYYLSGHELDVDNPQKFVIDALQGIFYNNDKQLIHQCSNKKSGEPKIVITLESLD